MTLLTPRLNGLMPKKRLPALSKRVRELRKAAEMTQRELAEASGVSLPRIRSLEQGQSTGVLLDTAQALADALGVTLNDLVKKPD